MSNAELRRKVGYKARRHGVRATPTAHGPERSYEEFSALPEEERACACEMDTVVGRSADTRCVLTLYLRPARFQLAMCLPEKTSGAVAAALDSLEAALGREGFQRLFGLLLTDTATEFGRHVGDLGRHVTGGRARTRLYYCDVLMSTAEGQVRAEPRRDEEAPAQGPRHPVRPPSTTTSHGPASGSSSTRKPSPSLGWRTPVRDAQGRLRARSPRTSGRARRWRNGPTRSSTFTLRAV